MLELFLLSIDTPEQNSKVEAIYINYYDKMVQVAYKILKNMPDSEDAAMNALMKICKDPERHIHYEDENDLKAMLYTITEHKAIDCFRKNRRSREKNVPLDEDLAGGIFELEDAITLKELEALRDSGEIEKKLYGVESVFEELSALHVKDEFQKLLDNGNPFFPNQTVENKKYPAGEWIRVYGKEKFYGIYAFEKEKHYYKPVKMFFEER